MKNIKNITAVKSPYLVPANGEFKVRHASTTPPKKAPDKAACKARLAELTEELAELQQVLYANDHRALLLVFQAMDAAGKDSTIRAVLSGVDPTGCQVTSFKQPTSTELEHDFLWRSAVALPERGRIGVFNRSHYEEVLVVRVHPEYLKNQRLHNLPGKLDTLWEQRYESIRNFEQHLAANGTTVIKFWLNVSKEEQRARFLARLEEPEKNWKFSAADITERGRWRDYMQAYEDAINATSRPQAPWYAIPADSKSYMRMVVAEIIVDTLKKMNLKYPTPAEEEKSRFTEMEKQLKAE